jgi:flagellar biosynthesis protein FlhB
MDQDSAETVGVSANSAWEIIRKHKTQLRKLKWIAATSWVIMLMCALFLHNLKDYVFKQSNDNIFSENEFWFVRFSDMVSIVLVVICVLLTYLVYAKSKTLTMLQICTRLDSIEEKLKKMSQEATCKP